MASVNEAKSSLCRHYCLYFLYKYGLGEDYGKQYLQALKLASNEKLVTAIMASEAGVAEVFDCISTDKVLELVKNKLLAHYIPLVERDEGISDKALLAMLLRALGKILQVMAKQAEARAKAEADGSKATPKGARKLGGGGAGVMSEDEDVDKPKTDKPLIDADADEVRSYTAEKLASIRKAISIIKDKDVVRSSGSYDRGKLVTRRLYKVKCKNYKIFTRSDTIGEGDKNIAFGLLIDESGSMFDSNGNGKSKSKIKQAILGASLLGEGLKRAGKLYAIWGFQGGFHSHKGFYDKHLTAQEYANIESFAEHNSEYGGSCYNSDGYALSRAVEEFAKLPSSYKKVLIVLSDGQPAPHSKFRSYDTKTEAGKAEQALSYVFSVVICSNSVTEFYRNCVVINNADELPEAITDCFRRVVGKRIR